MAGLTFIRQFNDREIRGYLHGMSCTKAKASSDAECVEGTTFSHASSVVSLDSHNESGTLFCFNFIESGPFGCHEVSDEYSLCTHPGMMTSFAGRFQFANFTPMHMQSMVLDSSLLSSFSGCCPIVHASTGEEALTHDGVTDCIICIILWTPSSSARPTRLIST